MMLVLVLFLILVLPCSSLLPVGPANPRHAGTGQRESELTSGRVRYMLPMIRDLVQHKWHANAALLKAIRQHDKAAQDEELRKLLHHILLANRFWLMLSLGWQFDF